MSSLLFGGSICITDLLDKIKSGHSSFSKSIKNGKVYSNILVWVNEEKDEFGNNISIQLSSSKEKRESEGKIYIGNAKKLETSKPVSSSDAPQGNWDANVPVRENNPPTTASEAADDLPF